MRLPIQLNYINVKLIFILRVWLFKADSFKVWIIKIDVQRLVLTNSFIFRFNDKLVQKNNLNYSKMCVKSI